jgi:hypothetical protein
VHQAVVLRLLENLETLGVGYAARPAGAHGELGQVPDRDAHVLFQVAAALAHEAAGDAARAVADGKLVVLLQPEGELLVGGRRGLRGNGLFDRDNMHAQAPAAHGDHGCGTLEGLQAQLLERAGDLRELLHLLDVHDHEFHDTGHEDGERILQLAVLPGGLHHADREELLKDPGSFPDGPAAFLRKLPG